MFVIEICIVATSTTIRRRFIHVQRICALSQRLTRGTPSPTRPDLVRYFLMLTSSGDCAQAPADPKSNGKVVVNEDDWVSSRFVACSIRTSAIKDGRYVWLTALNEVLMRLHRGAHFGNPFSCFVCFRRVNHCALMVHPHILLVPILFVVLILLTPACCQKA